MFEFSGKLIPLPTPFTDDGGTISEVRLARCLRWLNERSASGYVVGSDAGEFGALTLLERKRLFELTAQNVPAGTPILVHATTLGTMSTLELAQHAADGGARGVVVMPPYYGTFSDHEIDVHFQALARFAHVPVIVVDPLQRLDPCFSAELSRIPGITVGQPVFDSDLSDAACFERSSSDEFAFGNTYSLPMSFFGPLWREIDDPTYLALREMVNVFGVARVAKFAAGWMGLDLGPTRGPLQALPEPAREGLHRALCVAA